MVASFHSIPRLMISGLSGGSGKTFVSLGLTRLFSKLDNQIIPFKKGPDYIDAAWLGLASSTSCYCLDPFFMDDEQLKNHFVQSYLINKKKNNGIQSTIALIEGNRGLFDGKDVSGSCSSAKLAHLLNCPVIVSINCTKITRTVAAIILGLTNFDPELNLAGVILNNTGSSRHANLVRQSVETYTNVPVLGVLPRLAHNPIPERYMGLHLKKEEFEDNILDKIANFLQEHVDIDKILEIANDSPLIEQNKISSLDINLSSQEKDIKSAIEIKSNNKKDKNSQINIAYMYDDAFWFYYRENLEALKNLNVNLIPLSILNPKPFLEQANNIQIDALYIGGGFPELYAEEISKSNHLKEIKDYAEQDLPIYAECGGFMLLSKCIYTIENKEKKRFEMAGIFPVETEFFKKPQGLGYTVANTQIENPYHPLDSNWHGHEFHFSKSISSSDDFPYILNLNPGHGMVKKDNMGLDGLLFKQCFAAYTHLFAPAVPHWAENFVNAARNYNIKSKQ